VIDVSSIYGLSDDPTAAPAAESSCVITLSNGTAIYLREANRSLALVCILSDSVLQQQGLLEYNFGCFRDALFELFQKKAPPSSSKEPIEVR
jgi:Ras-related GTP-binding protein C/D